MLEDYAEKNGFTGIRHFTGDGILSKCVDVERLCEVANFQIPFNADEINLIYQFGEQGKAETCMELTITLYTRDKAVMWKLDTLVAGYPDTYKLIRQDKVSKTCSFPKSYISYHKPGEGGQNRTKGTGKANNG